MIRLDGRSRTLAQSQGRPGGRGCGASTISAPRQYSAPGRGRASVRSIVSRSGTKPDYESTYCSRFLRFCRGELLRDQSSVEVGQNRKYESTYRSRFLRFRLGSHQRRCDCRQNWIRIRDQCGAGEFWRLSGHVQTCYEV